MSDCFRVTFAQRLPLPLAGGLFSGNACPLRLTFFHVGLFSGQFFPTVAASACRWTVFGPFSTGWGTDGASDGAMYTHGHVHEGAPILKTLPPYRGICILRL